MGGGPLHSPQMESLHPLMWTPAAEQAYTYEDTAAHMQSSLFSQVQVSYMQFCGEAGLNASWFSQEHTRCFQLQALQSSSGHVLQKIAADQLLVTLKIYLSLFNKYI